jgi:hypothetical protein
MGKVKPQRLQLLIGFGAVAYYFYQLGELLHIV